MTTPTTYAPLSRSARLLLLAMGGLLGLALVGGGISAVLDPAPASRPAPRRCSECGRPLAGRRDKVTCSGSCRVMRSRRLSRIAPELHPPAELTGGRVPAHVPGAYPRLSCCGGPVALVPA